MSPVAISVRGLSKCFKITHDAAALAGYRTLRDELRSAPRCLLSALFGERSSAAETFWALKDVSLDIKEGEVVGIIGKNGAGKSTLLKVLSRITEPTSGKADVYGRIGALLEVGTGFHPELTGRENIFLNGAVLGMSRAEIRRKFDEIIAFAEIEKFLDTPVKHYSSGMHVRLAFAVAAHLDPEILLVDEVLAVGDTNFQKKCLGKMEDVTRAQGRTALFVTHNLGAIAQLCANVIWLDEGKVRSSGPSSSVIAQYLATNARRGKVSWPEGMANQTVTEFKLLSARVRNSDGRISATLENTKPFTVEIDYAITKPLWNLRVGFSLNTSDGLCVFTTCDGDDVEFRSRRTPGCYKACCEVPANLLGPSSYLVSVGADLPGVKILARGDNVLVIDVEDTSPHKTPWPREGIIQPLLKWRREDCGGWGSFSVN